MTSYSPPRSRPGGHHSAQEVIQAGERCPVQPGRGQDFVKSVYIHGTRMTVHDALHWKFLEWEHPVPLGADRSHLVWTDKAERHNRQPVAARPQPAPAPRRETPAYGLAKPE